MLLTIITVHVYTMRIDPSYSLRIDPTFDEMLLWHSVHATFRYMWIHGYGWNSVH